MGQEMVGSPLGTGSKARAKRSSPSSMGIARVREKPCCLESEDFLTNGVWMREG